MNLTRFLMKILIITSTFSINRRAIIFGCGRTNLLYLAMFHLHSVLCELDRVALSKRGKQGEQLLIANFLKNQINKLLVDHVIAITQNELTKFTYTKWVIIYVIMKHFDRLHTLEFIFHFNLIKFTFLFVLQNLILLKNFAILI